MIEEDITNRNFKIYSYYSKIANEAKSAIRKQIGDLSRLNDLNSELYPIWNSSELKYLKKSTKEVIERIHYIHGWFYVYIKNSKTEIQLISEGDTVWVSFDGIFESKEIKYYPVCMTHYGTDCIFGFEPTTDGGDIPITCVEINELSDGFLPSNYWTWTDEHHMFYKLTFL